MYVNSTLTAELNKKKMEDDDGSRRDDDDDGRSKIFWWTNNGNCTTYNFEYNVFHREPCDAKLPFICTPKKLEENGQLKLLYIGGAVLVFAIIMTQFLRWICKSKKSETIDTRTSETEFATTNSNMISVKQTS